MTSRKLGQRSPVPRHAARTAAAFALAAFAGLSAAADLAGADWPGYHGDWRGWRYSPLAQIDKKNVGKLKVAWIHQPGEITQGLQATPIVVDGVLYYAASANKTFAVDAATGRQLWSHAPELDPVFQKSLFGFYTRGVTVGRGKVYIGSTDGQLIALDQKTGKEVWKTRVLDPHKCHGCNFTSPPILAGGMLIAGPTGGDLAQRGKVHAVNADTGAAAWTLDTLKDDPKSWPADVIGAGGGGAWLPGQYDAKNDTFFIGTSNPAPDYNAHPRGGDNLYTSSILAIEPSTGRIKWHHQEVPNDAWDFDAAYEFVMLDAGGRELLMHLNKGGFVTLLDRKSGQVQDVWKFAEHVNWVKTVDKSGTLVGRRVPQAGQSDVFCPSALGARSWNAGAYSPATKLWYTNGHELCAKVTVGQQPVDKLAFSQPYFDVKEIDFVAPPGAKVSARFAAYDPLTGKQAWSLPSDAPGLAHVLATGGGLVFNGDPRGVLTAHDDRSGKPLWRFNVGSGMRGGIVSYAAGGKQYIVAATGFGSLFPAFSSGAWPEFKDLRGGAALIAFTVE